MTNFYVGQKVVCVSLPDIEGRNAELEIWPRIGEVYHLRAFDWQGDDLFVYLREIVNPVVIYADDVGECSFWIIHFRPVSEIDQFRKLVADIPKRKFVKEDAS